MSDVGFGQSSCGKCENDKNVENIHVTHARLYETLTRPPEVTDSNFDVACR